MICKGFAINFNYSQTEYIPIFTVDLDTWEKEFHTDQYLLFTGNGFISDSIQKGRQILEDLHNNGQ